MDTDLSVLKHKTLEVLKGGPGLGCLFGALGHFLVQHFSQQESQFK